MISLPQTRKTAPSTAFVEMQEKKRSIPMISDETAGQKTHSLRIISIRLGKDADVLFHVIRGSLV